MRIEKLLVTHLFGIFEHTVSLNSKDRITIIHGKNGFGKTIMLKIIDGIFNLRYSELRTIPFKHFQIDFDDGSHLELDKGDQDNLLTFYLTDSSKNRTEPFSPKSSVRDMDKDKLPLSMLDEIIPGLDRIGPKHWLYLPTNEELLLEDILERFEEPIKLLIGKKINEKTPEWLKDIGKSIHVRLIESQRLLKSYRNRRPYPQKISMVPSVTKYAEELAEDIQNKLADYGALSQSLDRTFPARVVQKTASLEVTDEELRQQLNQLEEKRHHLIDTGLLDKDENPNFQVTAQIDESTKKLLSVYVKDIEDKLIIFKEIAEKIDLFKRVINKKFSYKQIFISKEKGFIFINKNEKILSPTDLSSGEQHELILLYELLFKVKPNSLILIDEPELSLHVEWQIEFLKDLQDITKLADIDILIATHSPDIIHDRWDLTVQLKGPTQ